MLTLPTKRKMPSYYQQITEPIDLTTINQNIKNGKYSTIEQFDNDMIRVFNNAIQFYESTSEIGVAATKLKELYSEKKNKLLSNQANVPTKQNNKGMYS